MKKLLLAMFCMGMTTSFTTSANTIDSSVCYELRDYARIVMNVRQSQTATAGQLHKIARNGANGNALVGGLMASIIDDAFNAPVQPTVKTKLATTRRFSTAVYSECIKVL